MCVLINCRYTSFPLSNDFYFDMRYNLFFVFEGLFVWFVVIFSEKGVLVTMDHILAFEEKLPQNVDDMAEKNDKFSKVIGSN
eukprot:UN04765